jgi:conjugative relaxase-like TrwC/TraI family protein
MVLGCVVTVRVKPLSGSAAAITDYPLKHVKEIDRYYLAGSDPLGQAVGDGVERRLDEWEHTEWFGAGSTRLGLSGALNHETFGAVIAGLHPETGERLGRAFQDVDTGGSAPSRRAYDTNFNAPKSVSLLFAMAPDEAMRRDIHDAHVAAAKATISVIEEQSRTRYRLGDGTLVCVDTQGLTVGMAHQFTSRTGDPHIHTHAIISAKVQAPDGRWLALDARALMADQQTWSRVYHAGLEAELTNRLGVEWGPQTGAGHRELVGIDRTVIDGFSVRTAQAEAAIDQKMADFKESVGRDPSPKETWKLHREAVVETRPKKQADVADGFQRWAVQLEEEHGITPEELVDDVVGRNLEPVAHTQQTFDAIAADAVASVGEMHSAWRPNQLLRDLARDTQPSATTAAELVGELKAATRRAIEHNCVPLHELDEPQPAPTTPTPTSPVVEVGQVGQQALFGDDDGYELVTFNRDGTTTPEPRQTEPVRLEDPASGVPRRLSDGRPITTHALDELYTTPLIIAQEKYLTEWADNRIGMAGWDEDTGEALDVTTAEIRAYQPDGVELDIGQLEAAAAIASPRWVTLIEGPAGSGKTTCMAAAVTYLHEHDMPVFGCAPSAAAAQELSASTGLRADTLAKLLWEHTVRDGGPSAPYALPADTKIIVDEAGMVSTDNLHTLARLAEQNWWQVVLVGDGHQLSAVGRGGMFDHLVTTHPGDIQRLGTIQRFSEPWEREASLDLRRGRTDVLETYDSYGRFKTAVSVDDAIGQAATSWLKADANGERILITAATNETVNTVNERIQKTRLGQLDIGGTPVAIADGAKGYVCDLIVTRRNERDLQTDRGITVANRHTFEIINTRDDGSITAQGKTGRVELPAEYVRAHVQLAYATTAHGAQGRTVDNAVTIVEPATDHAGLYVALTRGRHTNTAIVPVDVSKTQTPVDVLAGVLRRDWADTPAHAQAEEIKQRQNVDVPATSVLRDPATAVKQTATVQPVQRPPVETKTLEPAHLKLLLEEQRTLTAELRMLPNRVGDAARQVDRLAPKVQQLQQTANGHRAAIAEQQKQLDGHKDGGVLHRARHGKTMERLETSILHQQQQLSFVDRDLSRDAPALQMYTSSLRDLQARQQVAPQRLDKISALIDRDREARVGNALQRGTVPAAVADALKPLGQRPREHGKEQAGFDRKLGDALQQQAAGLKVQPVKPPEQVQQIVRRGPSLGR